MTTTEAGPWPAYLKRVPPGSVVLKQADVDELVRDIEDMSSARQTKFERCGCGRMREVGVVCPTNQEGGDCEVGR